jgi:hypothetical protein
MTHARQRKARGGNNPQGEANLNEEKGGHGRTIVRATNRAPRARNLFSHSRVFFFRERGSRFFMEGKKTLDKSKVHDDI